MNTNYQLSPDYAELQKEFLEYERARVSQQGYDTIHKNSRRVLEWFEKEDLPLEEATVQDILRYKKHLSDLQTKEGKPLSAGTIQNYLKAGKRLFKYLLVTERKKSNPFEGIKYPRIGDHISRNVLTEEQMSELLTHLRNFSGGTNRRQNLVRYRCHVVSELLYASGIRILEAANLIPSDIDLKHRILTIQNGKGGKKRYAFLTSYSADILSTYLETGRQKTAELSIGNYSNTLFCASYTALSSSLNTELRRACTTLKIPVITCHGFRHSTGTHLLRAGCDMRYIQLILGHDKLSSTQIYTRINKDDLKRSLDDYHPRQLHKKS